MMVMMNICHLVRVVCKRFLYLRLISTWILIVNDDNTQSNTRLELKAIISNAFHMPRERFNSTVATLPWQSPCTTIYNKCPDYSKLRTRNDKPHKQLYDAKQPLIIGHHLNIKLRRSRDCFFPLFQLSFTFFSSFLSPNYAMQINALSI